VIDAGCRETERSATALVRRGGPRGGAGEPGWIGHPFTRSATSRRTCAPPPSACRPRCWSCAGSRLEPWSSTSRGATSKTDRSIAAGGESRGPSVVAGRVNRPGRIGTRDAASAPPPAPARGQSAPGRRGRV